MVYFIIESEIKSVEKTAQVLIKSESINVQKLDDYLHQIRRLINYFSLENDNLNLKQVFKNLRFVNLNIKDKKMFSQRLFEVETPFLTNSSVEYLHNDNDVNFLFAAWTMTAEEVEFDLMLYRHNTLTTLDNKKLAMALASTDESNFFLFDTMTGIKANGIKEEWVLRI